MTGSVGTGSREENASKKDLEPVLIQSEPGSLGQEKLAAIPSRRLPEAVFAAYLPVQTFEKYRGDDHDRPDRRTTRLRAGLRFPGSLYAADPRLLCRDRLHHALPRGALCRGAIPEAEEAAGAIAGDDHHHRGPLRFGQGRPGS